MANDLRGETELKLGDRKLRARVSWNAIREFETASGVRWNSLVHHVRTGDVGYTEIAHLAYAACKAGDKNFKDDFDEFADSLVAEGFVLASSIALELVTLGSVPRKALAAEKEAAQEGGANPSIGTS